MFLPAKRVPLNLSKALIRYGIGTDKSNNVQSYETHIVDTSKGAFRGTRQHWTLRSILKVSGSHSEEERK